MTYYDFFVLASTRNRAGSRWIRIPGGLKQIDSGNFGIVWGVNRHNHIWCRTGIRWNRPQGTGWRRVPGGLKYVSVGERGVWGVNRANHIYFRRGVTRGTPQGEKPLNLCPFDRFMMARYHNQYTINQTSEALDKMSQN